MDKKDYPDVISSEMHTALHEIVHVLGGMNPGTGTSNTPFINNAGANIDPRNTVYTATYDSVYQKMVSKIISPRVLNVTRTYFKCNTIDGFPLEDLPLGVGASLRLCVTCLCPPVPRHTPHPCPVVSHAASHWEARLAGPELMSYGSGSGQVYVGDITFAYLEDTNQVGGG